MAAHTKQTHFPWLKTLLQVDAMYLHAAEVEFLAALKYEKAIPRAEAKLLRLNQQVQRKVAKHGGDRWKAYNETESLYIAMESADYEIGMAYAPFVRSLAAIHILCGAALESHINIKAEQQLNGRLLDMFERFSLEAKWLVLPRLLGLAGFEPGREPYQGFSRLVKYRNELVHYKTRSEPWRAPGVPDFLVQLGLTKTAAERSIRITRQLIESLAKQMKEERPFWLHRKDISYFRVEGDDAT